MKITIAIIGKMYYNSVEAKCLRGVLCLLEKRKETKKKQKAQKSL